jgi:hypothetical protein
MKVSPDTAHIMTGPSDQDDFLDSNPAGGAFGNGWQQAMNGVVEMPESWSSRRTGENRIGRGHGDNACGDDD